MPYSRLHPNSPRSRIQEVVRKFPDQVARDTALAVTDILGVARFDVLGDEAVEQWKGDWTSRFPDGRPHPNEALVPWVAKQLNNLYRKIILADDDELKKDLWNQYYAMKDSLKYLYEIAAWAGATKPDLSQISLEQAIDEASKYADAEEQRATRPRFGETHTDEQRPCARCGAHTVTSADMEGGSRYCGVCWSSLTGPAKVIKINIDLMTPQFTDRDRDILGKIREISRRYGHPVEEHPLFTIGWVRYRESPATNTILVEELQSDVVYLDYQKGEELYDLRDPQARQHLEAGGLGAKEIEAAASILLPYTEAFYNTALQPIYDIANKGGKKIEYLYYNTRRQLRLPSAVYTEQPRSMRKRLGFESYSVSGDDYVEQTRKIKPNRRRTARKTSRRTRRTSRR